jgi:ring-1,2-phenylacetyl-CoA epoxidase subunit PaaA
MYAQALDQKDRAPAAAEDPERLARFEARCAADDKIEATDWMPEAYRRTLVRQISSTPIPRSSACSPRATGPRARPP